MEAEVKHLADELCDGRLLFTLEGGYNIEALSHSIKATFETLLELNAPNSLIKEHVGELGSPKHWRQWQEILKERVTSREIGNKSYKELFADLKLEDGQ